jgi:ribosomal protein L11 methyltransferase
MDEFMKRWMVFELHIPKEIREGVSNFLIEQGATGVEEFDEGLEWESLRTYFPQDGEEKKVLYGLRRYLKSLRKIFPGSPRAQIKITSIPEQDWGENWKRFFKPVQVTSRFVVRPSWSKVRLKKRQIAIAITPGMAFGTGTHATTILSIQALEERLPKRGFSVLDVGTGSGILSIIASKLGAKEVWGIDIDGVAVKNARENLELNRVSNNVKIRKGSIGVLQKKFDVIIANIDFKSLRRMRGSLLSHLKNKGFLLLSGILEEDEKRLREHYLEIGRCQWIHVARREGWICLTFRKVRK